jgi:hypothetical protein
MTLLMDVRYMTRYDLAEVSSYAHGIGPDASGLFNNSFLEIAK